MAATDGGLQATYLLGCGDMRRSLNILQARAEAGKEAGKVNAPGRCVPAACRLSPAPPTLSRPRFGLRLQIPPLSPPLRARSPPAWLLAAWTRRRSIAPPDSRGLRT